MSIKNCQNITTKPNKIFISLVRNSAFLIMHSEVKTFCSKFSYQKCIQGQCLHISKKHSTLALHSEQNSTLRTRQSISYITITNQMHLTGQGIISKWSSMNRKVSTNVSANSGYTQVRLLAKILVSDSHARKLTYRTLKVHMHE